MQFNNPHRKIKKNMTVQHLIKLMGRSPSRTSVMRLAVQRKKFSFPDTPMKFSLKLLVLLLSASFCLQASAAAFTITNTGDNGGVNPAPGAGTGTLRQAIVDSNANAGADSITFNPGVTGTILLPAALPNLADDLIISGPGANVLTVLRPEGTCSDNGATCTGDTSPCANPATAICVATADFGIFSVDSGKAVTISGLTITGGIGTGGVSGMITRH
jgi:hypothetical protein